MTSSESGRATPVVVEVVGRMQRFETDGDGRAPRSRGRRTSASVVRTVEPSGRVIST